MRQEFYDKVKNLYETDIGDFKRKIILYLNRFQEQTQKQEERHPLDFSFHKIRDIVMCNNTTDIELLRLQVMKEILHSEEKIQQERSSKV